MGSSDTSVVERTGSRLRRETQAREDFDSSLGWVRDDLVDRYGEVEAAALDRHARERHAEIVPKVAWVEAWQGLATNVFPGSAAQEFAVHVSSQTPEVQAAVERIAREESTGGALGPRVARRGHRLIGPLGCLSETRPRGRPSAGVR